MSTNKKRASVTVDVKVPLEIAWRGITDSRELQIWLAQHANLSDNDEQKVLQLGGKHLPFLKYEERMDHTVTDFNPEAKSLSYLWKLRTRDGDLIDTEVRFRLSPMNEYSRLDVDHIVGEDDISDDDLRNLWAILLNGYVFHMEGAAAWVRPDFAPRKGSSFQLDAWIAARREDVYQTLTTVEGIQGFFAPKVNEVQLEVDGTLDLGWDKLPIREVEENSKFAFGWREVADEDPNLTITWELKDEGNGTRLVLTEGELSESVAYCTRADYVGWAAVMNDLKRFLETRRHPIFLSILVEPHTEK